MIAYVHDNPRRAMIKRSRPDLFRIRRRVEKAGVEFTALGNMFLLDYPEKAVVQCSRSLTADEIAKQKAEFLSLAERGVVCVSAAISEGEKQICRAIRENGYPLIILMKEGFPKETDEASTYYKPGGVYFDACAKGKLLLLEPDEKVYEMEEICSAVLRKAQAELPHSSMRYRFLALNEVAERMAE